MIDLIKFKSAVVWLFSTFGHTELPSPNYEFLKSPSPYVVIYCVYLYFTPVLLYTFALKSAVLNPCIKFIFFFYFTFDTFSL